MGMKEGGQLTGNQCLARPRRAMEQDSTDVLDTKALGHIGREQARRQGTPKQGLDLHVETTDAKLVQEGGGGSGRGGGGGGAFRVVLEKGTEHGKGGSVGGIGGGGGSSGGLLGVGFLAGHGVKKMQKLLCVVGSTCYACVCVGLHAW